MVYFCDLGPTSISTVVKSLNWARISLRSVSVPMRMGFR